MKCWHQTVPHTWNKFCWQKTVVKIAERDRKVFIYRRLKLIRIAFLSCRNCRRNLLLFKFVRCTFLGWPNVFYSRFPLFQSLLIRLLQKRCERNLLIFLSIEIYSFLLHWIILPLIVSLYYILIIDQLR